jgi:rhodanese-related sulfurtransferase
LIQAGTAPVVLDVRSASARDMDPRRIPGAIATDIEDLDAQLAALPPDREIILYCT